MSDLKITQLTTLAAVPDNADWLPIVDVSDTTMSASGTTKKIAASRFVNTNANKTFVTGDGTEGILPAAGTVAVISRANTFTTTQTFTAGAGATPVTINTVSDGSGIGITGLDVASFDHGAGPGARLLIGRNNNASTPAAAALGMRALNNTLRFLWFDNSGLVRASAISSAPVNGTDTSAGGVVGDQTSNAAFKDIIGDPVSDDDALAAIIAAAETVKRFTYADGRYNGQEFSGIILEGDALGRYGKDATEDYPAGRSLNDINLIGDLVKAVRRLAARVEALEAAL